MVTCCKRNHKRADFKKFRFLLASNDDATVTLPANSRVSIRSVAGCIAGTTACVLTGPRTLTGYNASTGVSTYSATRTIKTKVLAAGGRVVIDRVARGTLITLQAGFEAWIDNGLGKWRKIAAA